MANTKPKQQPPPPGPPKRAWGRALLTAFVAAWMFALGVLVGRGTAPVQFDLDALQKQLAGMKEMVTAEEGQRFKINLEKLKFFKNLKEAETDDHDSEGGFPAPKRPADAPEAPIPHKTALTKKPTERTTGEVDAPSLAPAGSVAEAPKAATESGQGELVIQVASSKDAEATRYLVGRLQKKGYPAFSALKEVPDKGVWHRIRVGPYSDRKAADEVLVRLKKDKFNAYIVKP